MTIAINKFDRNQIDFIGLQTTSPDHALSVFSEKTLSVFFIICLEPVNAASKGER